LRCRNCAISRSQISGFQISRSPISDSPP